MMWYLWVNYPAGEFEVTSTPDRFDDRFDLAGEYNSEEAALDEVQRIKSESTVYAVFFDAPAGQGYVSKENDLSGNWRGSRDCPYNCVAEFNTEAEAEDYLATLLR